MMKRMRRRRKIRRRKEKEISMQRLGLTIIVKCHKCQNFKVSFSFNVKLESNEEWEGRK
jgi:hypothetical protein